MVAHLSAHTAYWPRLQVGTSRERKAAFTPEMHANSALVLCQGCGAKGIGEPGKDVFASPKHAVGCP